MSLLKEIFERLDYERLIAEGKDPVEVLHYKFKHVPIRVVDKVIEIDPTKKKTYSQWLLSKWDNESDVITNNLNNGRISKLFEYFKSHQEIQIKDFGSVAEVLRDFIPEEDTVLTKSGKPTTYVMNLEKEVPSELANDFDIVFDEDNWIIAVPNTYESSCKLGENMKWCTANAYGNGEGHYGEYLEKGGKLYVNFDMTQGESRHGKDYPYTRYQFHFETNQFRDKHNEQVDVSSIGMPESAIEFYKEEGYDESDFENEEERYERYVELRDQNFYGLADGLWLNISFDDNLEYREPNEGTDFYIFDENDDRDPISWESVPNPNFHDDVIRLNRVNRGYLIIREKYRGYNLLVIKDSDSSYRDWSVYPIHSYLELPSKDGVFCINDDWHASIYLSDGHEDYDELEFKGDDVKIWESSNFNTSDEQVYFEVINSDGYHSLFSMYNGELYCVVHKDKPENGKYYFIGDDGLIHGEFKTYRPAEFDEEGYLVDYDDEDTPDYNLVKRLESGDYLVSKNFSVMGGYVKKVNVVKSDDRRLLFNIWFEDLDYEIGNLYVFSYGDKHGVFSVNGEQIGCLYSDVNGVNKKNMTLVGNVRDPRKNIVRSDIINGIDLRVVGSFKQVSLRMFFNNGKTLVMDENNNRVFFDYLSGQLCYPNITDIVIINKTWYPSLFLCKIDGYEGKCIFNLETEKIISDGVETLQQFSRFDNDNFKIIKTNGKENVFDKYKMSQILDRDVDEVIGISSEANVLSYMEGGRGYIYNYVNGNMELNPNGFEFKPYVYDKGTVGFQSDNFKLFFSPGTNGEYTFESWECNGYVEGAVYSGGCDLDKETTPPEVLAMYASITGQQPAVTEAFRLMVRRMNEARRKTYREVID